VLGVFNDHGYREAESEIRGILGSVGGPMNPRELVRRVNGRGIPLDVGSAVMWELIGFGELELSKNWLVSLPEHPIAVTS
jgi:hypothetical protein